MKKVVYLAPIFLLSFLGKNAMASQVEHVSNLDSALEQASAINNSTADTNRNTTVLQNQVLNINKTNQTAIPDSIKQSTGFQDEKIAANTNVTINNPANNRIHVHWVDANGNAVEDSSHDYDIDATETGQGSYTVPDGYRLNNPDGKYTVSGGAFNGTNLHASISPVAPTYEQHLSTGNDVDDKILQDHGALDLANKIKTDYATAPETETDYTTETVGSYTGPMKLVATQITGTDTVYYKFDNQYSWSTMPKPIYGIFGLTGGYENWSTDKVMSDSELDSMYSQGSDKVVQYMSVQTKPGYTNQILPVAFVDANNNIVGMIQNYTGKVGTTQNVSLTVPTGYKLADGASLPTSVTFTNSTDPKLIHVVLNGQVSDINAPVNGTNIRYPINYTVHVKFVDQQTGQDVGGSYDIDVAHQGNESKISMGGDKVANGTQGAGIYLAPKFYPSVGTYNVPAGYATNNNQYDINIQRQLIFVNEPNGQTDDLSFLTDDEYAKLMNGLAAFDDTVWPGVNTSKGAYASFNQASSYYNFGPNSIVAHQSGIPDNEIVMALTLRDGTKIVKPLPGLSQEEARDIYNRLMSHIDSNIFDYPELSTTFSGRSVGIRDTGNIVNGNTVTVPVHRTNSFTFSDNSGNVKSYSGNTVNVILEHQTKRIDPNNSSLNLAANNQLHLINTSQEQPKQSTANFKVGYLLDLVTNNKIIDTNNTQALNNTKIFTVNPSLPIGYDSLNTKLLTLNL